MHWIGKSQNFSQISLIGNQCQYWWNLEQNLFSDFVFDRTFIIVSKCPLGTIFVFVKVRILLLCYLYLRFLVTFDNNLLEQRCIIVNVQCLVSIMSYNYVTKICGLYKIIPRVCQRPISRTEFSLVCAPRVWWTNRPQLFVKICSTLLSDFYFSACFSKMWKPLLLQQALCIFFLLEGQNYLQISRPLDRT